MSFLCVFDTLLLYHSGRGLSQKGEKKPAGWAEGFGMRAAYRVAAPSIRFVPWAALASCWPLPQQLLSVSATGGGRRCCTLRISSGRIILNLQCWKICGFSSIAFSQEGVVTGNGISAKRRKKAPEGFPGEGKLFGEKGKRKTNSFFRYRSGYVSSLRRLPQTQQYRSGR